MGLIEIVLATLCLNSTCLLDEDLSESKFLSKSIQNPKCVSAYQDVSVNTRKMQFAQLAEELRQENLIITTLKVPNCAIRALIL
jgi:hypothetical protein